MKDKPNIVMIIMDSTRFDHLSCYGYRKKTTPNLDIIAEEGVLYKNAISTSPWTLPSHTSIFTGLYLLQHKTGHNNPFLNPKFSTIAEVLSVNGYTTLGFSNNPYIGHATGLNRGFEVFEDIAPRSKYRSYVNGINRKEIGTSSKIDDSDAHFVNITIKGYLDNLCNSPKPFFLFVNYIEPHIPYHPPLSFIKRFIDGNSEIEKVIGFDQGLFIKYMVGGLRLDNKDIDAFQGLYDSEIAYLDYKLREIFEYLLLKNILDDTILIITSDHGENIGDHQLFDHQYCLYDTLLHVPLIIRYPRLFPPGLKIVEQVQSIDIFPTLLEILDVTPNLEYMGKPFGKSLLPHRIKDDPNPREFTFAEYERPINPIRRLNDRYPKFDMSIYDYSLKMIRSNTFKYIKRSDGKDELYNLIQDPKELNNIISLYTDKGREFEERLYNWISLLSLGCPEIVIGSYEFDEDIKRLLQGLGYLT
ncbi:MAG: sulfatase [Nitrospinae bacterium]|nr:sulfatase [Nitrospinota bacterium]